MREDMFGCFRMIDRTGETLCEGIVHAAGHPVAFFQNSRLSPRVAELQS